MTRLDVLRKRLGIATAKRTKLSLGQDRQSPPWTMDAEIKTTPCERP